MIRATALAKAYDNANSDEELEFFAKAIVDALNKNRHYISSAVVNPTWQEATKAFADTPYYVHGSPQYFDKIQVIKFARNLGALGLKETKDWVEANILRFKVNF